MTRLETGPIWHRLRVRETTRDVAYAAMGSTTNPTDTRPDRDLRIVLDELIRITGTLEDMCDDADAEPLPGKGLLATDTVRAVIRGDQPA